MASGGVAGGGGGGGGGVWVFYYLQGEDGDCVETPNAFNVTSAANEVRLGQFLQSFPLRGNGEYHFRFRAPDQISGYCWMDVSDLSAVLPRYDNAVCAKALRLDRLPKPRSSRLRRKAPYGASASAAAQQGKRGVGVGSGGGMGGVRSRPAEQPQKPATKGQWHGGLQHERPRSASPATHHHDIHGDIRRNSSQGKSATPPHNHAGRKSFAGGANGGGSLGRGPPPPPPPPPPPAGDPENLEAFLFSDSPVQSPRSGRAPSGSDFQQHLGSSNSSNNSSSGSLNGVSAGNASTVPNPSPAAAGRAGGDLLNFGNTGGGGAAAAAAAAAGAAAKTGLAGSARARAAPGAAGSPRAWGVRPPQPGGGAGDRSPVQPSSVNAGGARRQTMAGAPTPAAFGPKGGAGGARMNGRPNSVSGGAAPDLMNVNGAGGAGKKSGYVKTKIEDREKELQDKQEEAKKVLKDREEAAAKDQENLDAAKQKHDVKLTAWAEDHGKKRNVRTLLSTMHTVLWEGNRWKPVTMGDLLQPSKVKLNYRKAMLLVHPDKCGNLGPEARLIAKRVFEAVNEAYTVFSEKEMG